MKRKQNTTERRTLKTFSPLALVILTLLALTASASIPHVQAEALRPWKSTKPYPNSSQNPECVTYAAYIFCGFQYGGYAYYASLSGGGVGTWTQTTSYPGGYGPGTCVAYLGYVYCLGGNSIPGFYASLSSGGVGTWTQTATDSSTASFGPCVVSAGYVFCVGSGGDVPGFYASLSSGGVGTWTQTTTYPNNTSPSSCVAYLSFVYCVGGGNPAPTDAVYYASLSGAGIGAWKNTTVAYKGLCQGSGCVGAPIDDESCVAYLGYIYCIGGLQEPVSVYYALLSGSGVGLWTLDWPSSYPIGIDDESCVTDSGYIYCVGGYDTVTPGYTTAAYYAAIGPPPPASVNVNPGSGPTGTVVTLSGSDYTPSATYSYCLSSSSSSVSCVASTVANFTADGSGNIPLDTTLTVPPGATPRTYYVVVYSGSAITAYALFTVNASISSVMAGSSANNTALSTAYVPINVEIVTSPTSLEKYANVSVYVNSTTPVCPLTNATSSGFYSCAYQVQKTGTYQVNVTATIALPSDSESFFSGNYYFTAGPIVEKIPLVQGWNLISLPIVPPSTNIGTVLASQIAGGNLTVVWSYQGGKWLSAMLSGDKLTGTLTTIQDGYGYWIYMTKPDNLFVVGSDFESTPATPPSYPLSVGWNLIGFTPEPTIQSETTSSYLISLNGNYNRVYLYDNSLGTWTENPSSVGPGQAIWVYLTAPATLTP